MIKIGENLEEILGSSKTPEQMFEEKKDLINKSQTKKQDSIKEFAIRRDSALFASSAKSKDELKEDYNYWREFFEEQYGK